MSKMLKKAGQRQTGSVNGRLMDNPRQALTTINHFQRCFIANGLKKIFYGNGHRFAFRRFGLNLVVQFLLKIREFGAMLDALMIHRLVP